MASRLLNQAPVYLDDAGAPVAGGTLYFYVNGDTNTPKNVYGDKALSVNLGATELLDAGGRQVNDIWLDGSYTVILKTAGDVQVWERDDVEAPSELPDVSGNNGKFVTVTAGAYALAEIEQLPDYSGANDDDVLKIVAGEPFWGAPDPVPDYAGSVLEQPVFLNERTTSQAVTATATLALNYALGAVVELAQDTNITTLTFGNFGAANKWARMLIVRTKDNTGTARTIAWGAVKWAGGTPPSLTSTANAIDVIELWSNGTTVLGFSRGLAMA
jgi:hypothetical protein